VIQGQDFSDQRHQLSISAILAIPNQWQSVVRLFLFKLLPELRHLLF
jgi:hypothetical protein